MSKTRLKTHCVLEVFFWRFGLDLGAFGDPLGGSWAPLGRLFGGSWVPLGVSWEPLGPLEAPKSSPRPPKKRFLSVWGPKMEAKSTPNRAKVDAKSIQTLWYFQIHSRYAFLSRDPRESPKRPHRRLKAQSSKLNAKS